MLPAVPSITLALMPGLEKTFKPSIGNNFILSFLICFFFLQITSLHNQHERKKIIKLYDSGSNNSCAGDIIAVNVQEPKV